MLITNSLVRGREEPLRNELSSHSGLQLYNENDNVVRLNSLKVNSFLFTPWK